MDHEQIPHQETKRRAETPRQRALVLLTFGLMSMMAPNSEAGKLRRIGDVIGRASERVERADQIRRDHERDRLNLYFDHELRQNDYKRQQIEDDHRQERQKLDHDLEDFDRITREREIDTEYQFDLDAMNAEAEGETAKILGRSDVRKKLEAQNLKYEQIRLSYEQQRAQESKRFETERTRIDTEHDRETTSIEQLRRDLQRRFAQGEIKNDEYDKAMQDLEQRRDTSDQKRRDAQETNERNNRDAINDLEIKHRDSLSTQVRTADSVERDLEESGELNEVNARLVRDIRERSNRKYLDKFRIQRERERDALERGGDALDQKRDKALRDVDRERDMLEENRRRAIEALDNDRDWVVFARETVDDVVR